MPTVHGGCEAYLDSFAANLAADTVPICRFRETSGGFPFNPH